MSRGFFEIGIYRGKTKENLGTLWRSAIQLGASGIFTIGPRYSYQSSDTTKTTRHIPYRSYLSFDEFYSNLPYGCRLISIEMGGDPLKTFDHPQQAVYLLGSEDNGLPEDVLNKCHKRISIESINNNSYNVAVAGSLVMYHRQISS